MMNFTYIQMCKELPQIRQQFMNGDFDDLVEEFGYTEDGTPNDVYNAVSNFTTRGTVYFEALIRFIESKVIMNM